MKYLLIASFITVSALVTACGGGDKKETPATIETPATNNTPADPADLSSDPVYAEGLALVKNSDCLTCHREHSKVNGPSYDEIAAKYTNDEKTITMLAGKIIKGGKGVWGETEMTAHPGLSQQDAEKMVKYIFKLKK
jgi:cytochrome c